MKSNPRGLAVIINNHFFVNMAPREGTNCDFVMLQNLFTELKFKVETFGGLKAQVSIFCETVSADLVLIWLTFL